MIQGSNWKKPEEKIVLSTTDALRLVTEARPHVEGTTVGSYPYIEKLANIVGINLNQTN